MIVKIEHYCTLLSLLFAVASRTMTAILPARLLMKLECAVFGVRECLTIDFDILL